VGFLLRKRPEQTKILESFVFLSVRTTMFFSSHMALNHSL
jgi:hypothetical protein